MEYHLLSDPLLAQLLRVNDELAFQEIYRRYWETLYENARRKLSRDEEAEGLVQDVFMSIWEKRASQEIDNLGGYLVSALKYRIIDSYRTQALTERYHEYALAKNSPGAPSPQEEFNFEEILHIFEKALEHLPDKTARIFRMSRLEFRSTRDISQNLGIPERTVEYHITRSLQMMRRQLKDFLPALLFVCLTS